MRQVAVVQNPVSSNFFNLISITVTEVDEGATSSLGKENLPVMGDQKVPPIGLGVPPAEYSAEYELRNFCVDPGRRLVWCRGP